MVITLLVILGLCFGSFVNAFVWRLHENKDWVRGRSMCPDCEHILAWYDLLPVVSWISLRGHCRYCHKSISWQYPVVELLTAGVFIVSYLYWPYKFDAEGLLLFTFWLTILVGFMTLTIYDLKWFLLPDKVVFPLIGLGLLMVLVRAGLFRNDLGHLVDGFIGGSTLFGLFYGLFQVSKGAWIGGGDVKLAFLLGLLAGGFLEAILLLFLASIIGSFVSLPFLISKKLKPSSQIPFGPFLMMATFIVYIFGASLLDWLRGQYFYL